MRAERGTEQGAPVQTRHGMHVRKCVRMVMRTCQDVRTPVCELCACACVRAGARASNVRVDGKGLIPQWMGRAWYCALMKLVHGHLNRCSCRPR